jgi:hypothetical protein
LLFRLPDDRFSGAHVSFFGQRLALDELGPADDAVERSAQIVRGDTQIVVGETIDAHRGS